MYEGKAVQIAEEELTSTIASKLSIVISFDTFHDVCSLKSIRVGSCCTAVTNTKAKHNLVGLTREEIIGNFGVNA